MDLIDPVLSIATTLFDIPCGVMDLVDPILSIATTLYALCEEVKANSTRCKRLKERVKGLELMLRATKQKGVPQVSPEVRTALEELKLTLESAAEVIRNYNADKKSLVRRLLKTKNYGDEFGSLNDRLNDAFQILSLNLQVHMDQNVTRLFDAASQREQDEADKKEDHAEIQTMLLHIMDQQDSMGEKMEAMSLKQDAHHADLKQCIKTADLKQSIETLKNSERIPKDIRKIIPQDLSFDLPIEPFMTTDFSEVYKGEYRHFPVAIKKYLCAKPVITSDVLTIFEREIETMIRYESPFILRMFGICIKGADGLIVMEYCEMGGLREVLDNRRIQLGWSVKARMCLDAAQGIYRLHQSEQKSKVHGGITSDKFMVAEGYRVKLGGLELAATETSLRKNTRPQKGSLRYRSPEQLETVNHSYCKACEIYSLGMVLWEIATRKRALADCAKNHDIFKRVCDEKRVLEPLPDDCPEKLAALINACRAYDDFKRPTAGVLVDHLCKLVAQMKVVYAADGGSQD